jgi:hypothetical protein
MTVAQLYRLPHGILRVFNTILYENEFQNPQILKQTNALVFFPSNLNCFADNFLTPAGSNCQFLCSDNIPKETQAILTL